MIRKLLVSLTMILALTLSACENAGSTTNPSFTITDFAFAPNEFTITAGQEITLKLTHNGTMEHNFIIMKYGTDAGTMFDEADESNVLWKMSLQPGDTKTVVFAAPEQPGTYQILCGMPGHMQSGMVGRLIVTSQQ
jgi:uncharacterized cupredoxin-like copper-binding protein